MTQTKRDRTKRRLVEAAMKVVAERGFHGASVNAIAEQAGFSIGALYAHFENKDAVLFAVFHEHLHWFYDSLERAAESPDLAEGISDWLAALGRDPEQFLVFVEFWAYAVRRPKLRKQLEVHMAEMRESMSDAVAKRFGDGAALSPALAAQLAMALARGLAFEKLTAPDAVDDDAVAGLLATLLGGSA